MRPDLWYWTEKKGVRTLWLIEVKVAWGSCRPDEAGEEENTLQQVYLEAQRKYDKEVDFIKSIKWKG
jgi:hypothetical protein